MKRKHIVLLVALLLCLSCILAFKMSSDRYHNRYEALVQEIQSASSFWQEQLLWLEAGEPEDDLLDCCIPSGFEEFVKEVEAESQYGGISLVTKRSFFQKEAVLITLEKLDEVPMAANTGVSLVLLTNQQDIKIYKLIYYWD